MSIYGPLRLLQKMERNISGKPKEKQINKNLHETAFRNFVFLVQNKIISLLVRECQKIF
jgi:hypothetical protein